MKLKLEQKHAYLLSDESLRIPCDEDECGAAGPHGLVCTRESGHDRDTPHVAHVENEAVAMWVDVDAKPLGNGCARYALLDVK